MTIKTNSTNIINKNLKKIIHTSTQHKNTSLSYTNTKI